MLKMLRDRLDPPGVNSTMKELIVLHEMKTSLLIVVQDLSKNDVLKKVLSIFELLCSNFDIFF